MTTIFYLSTIIFIWIELKWILSPIEKTKDTESFMNLTKEFKGKKWDDYSSDYKSQLIAKMPNLFIILWLMIGLFTSQWILFLLILLFNLGIVAPISKLTKYSIFYTILHWFNSVIGLIFGLFIIINHYHLGINTTDLIVTYFNHFIK
jgi:hypothetical protein